VLNAINCILGTPKSRRGDRAGLTIGQTGQMPEVSRLNIETLLYWFFMFLGSSPRVKIAEIFDYCV